jgi:hypothetical protein
MEAKFQESYTIFRAVLVSAIQTGDQHISENKSSLLTVPSTHKAKIDETGEAKKLSHALLVHDKPRSVVKKEKTKKIPYFESSF